MHISESEPPVTMEIVLDGDQEATTLWRTQEATYVNDTAGYAIYDYVNAASIDPNNPDAEPEVRGMAMNVSPDCATPVWQLLGGEHGNYSEREYADAGAGFMVMQDPEGARNYVPLLPDQAPIELRKGWSFQIVAGQIGVRLMSQLTTERFVYGVCEIELTGFPSVTA